MKNPIRNLVTLILLGLPIYCMAAVPTCISKHFPEQKLVENAIKLDAPDIAENGSVISVGIESIADIPDNTYIKELTYFNEFRNEPVARFKFSEKTKGTSIKTRVRLRKSSNFYAVAKLSNGQYLAGQRFIKVTIGGCGGGEGVDNVSNEKSICVE